MIDVVLYCVVDVRAGRPGWETRRSAKSFLRSLGTRTAAAGESSLNGAPLPIGGLSSTMFQ